MPPVRRHRIGDRRPRVVHPSPDPAAIALCRDLVAGSDARCAVLFGSRARGGWDEQSDLDLIIIRQGAVGGETGALDQVLGRLRERHYPGYQHYESPHYGVGQGQMIETPERYGSHRRTRNHLMARAAREGLVFPREPGTEQSYRHDGDDSNEWELVTLELLRQAASTHRVIGVLRERMPWYAEGDPPARRHPISVHTTQGRYAHRLLWESGAALLSILGVVYPRDSVAEMAPALAEHDPGWSHAFRSDLERIDQYSDCGCEVVVTDPIDDVSAMWRALEADREALWERIQLLSGYDLAAAPVSSDEEG